MTTPSPTGPGLNGYPAQAQQPGVPGSAGSLWGQVSTGITGLLSLRSSSSTLVYVPDPEGEHRLTRLISFIFGRPSSRGEHIGLALGFVALKQNEELL